MVIQVRDFTTAARRVPSPDAHGDPGPSSMAAMHPASSDVTRFSSPDELFDDIESSSDIEVVPSPVDRGNDDHQSSHDDDDVWASSGDELQFRFR